MLARDELSQDRAVKLVRRSVQAQSSWRDGGDGAAVFSDDKGFGERVELREVKKAVQAIHCEDDGGGREGRGL